MAVSDNTNSSPDWDALYEIAEGQEGLFTTRQAAEAGYSSPLLHKYLESGKILRLRRGIYRLKHFPAGEREDLMTLWLWSDHEGVFSHQTALAIHDLSDALPARVHMTVPETWRRRRLRLPDGLVLHYADLEPEERSRRELVPATVPKRTLRDCAESDVAPDLVRDALADARRRGLISMSDASEIENALAFAA